MYSAFTAPKQNILFTLAFIPVHSGSENEKKSSKSYLEVNYRKSQ